MTETAKACELCTDNLSWGGGGEWSNKSIFACSHFHILETKITIHKCYNTRDTAGLHKKGPFPEKFSTYLLTV